MLFVGPPNQCGPSTKLAMSKAVRCTVDTGLAVAVVASLLPVMPGLLRICSDFLNSCVVVLLEVDVAK